MGWEQKDEIMNEWGGSFLPGGGMPGMPGGSWWGGGTPGWSGGMLPMLTMPSTGPCKGGSTGG